MSYLRKVVRKMGSLTQNENLKYKNEYKSKIPEYAREYKREWQYIRGINKTCGMFLNKLYKIDFTGGYNEEFFLSNLAKRLMLDFSIFCKAQKSGKFKDNSKSCFKNSDFYGILDLYSKLYNVVYLNESDIFKDFFESFILFYYNINLNNAEFIPEDLREPDEIVKDEEGNDVLVYHGKNKNDGSHLFDSNFPYFFKSEISDNDSEISDTDSEISESDSDDNNNQNDLIIFSDSDS